MWTNATGNMPRFPGFDVSNTPSCEIQRKKRGEEAWNAQLIGDGVSLLRYHPVFVVGLIVDDLDDVAGLEGQFVWKIWKSIRHISTWKSWKKCEVLLLELTELINQSIERTNDQSISHAFNQWINRAKNQSVNWTVFTLMISFTVEKRLTPPRSISCHLSRRRLGPTPSSKCSWILPSRVPTNALIAQRRDGGLRIARETVSAENGRFGCHGWTTPTGESTPWTGTASQTALEFRL